MFERSRQENFFVRSAAVDQRLTTISTVLVRPWFDAKRSGTAVGLRGARIDPRAQEKAIDRADALAVTRYQTFIT
jgi:hypothetical protein